MSFSLINEFYLKSTIYTSNLQITEQYTSVKIEINNADLVLIPSNNKTSNIKFISNKLVSFDYEVIDGELVIKQSDKRKFFQKIFNFTDYNIFVYLSNKNLDSLVVNSINGDCTINEGLTFNNVNINATTTDIDYNGGVKEDINIHTTTGDIEIKNVSCNNLNIECSTGDVDLFNMYVSNSTYIKTTTGEVELKSLMCNNLNIKVSTGDIDLEKVNVTSDLIIKGTTGDVLFDQLEAGSIYIDLSTGDVKGSLTKEMIFNVTSTTGNIRVPESSIGGICKVEVTTGNVHITFYDKN